MVHAAGKIWMDGRPDAVREDKSDFRIPVLRTSILATMLPQLADGESISLQAR